MDAVLERARIKRLGVLEYAAAVAAMRTLTLQRNAQMPDEIWVLEHPPVYTLGAGADPAQALRIDKAIPVVRAERGGEITYHGPGQAVLYTLVDLQRRGLRVKEFVRLLEQAVIDLLAQHDVIAERKPGAPGVYVDGAKIAALGIRVSRGCAWHGLALNVDMDLAPFAAIDPCGYPGLPVTQAKDLGVRGSAPEVGERVARIIVERLEHA